MKQHDAERGDERGVCGFQRTQEAVMKGKGSWGQGGFQLRARALAATAQHIATAALLVHNIPTAGVWV